MQAQLRASPAMRTPSPSPATQSPSPHPHYWYQRACIPVEGTSDGVQGRTHGYNSLPALLCAGNPSSSEFNMCEGNKHLPYLYSV